MLVYISGPITAHTGWGQEQNIRKAEEAWFELAKNGIPAICPHTMGRFFMGELRPYKWVVLDLEILGKCDSMLLVGEEPAIKNSIGTQKEIEFAAINGIPIFRDIASIVGARTKELEKEKK